MLEAMTRNWWLYLTRGLLAILFGVLAYFWPELALVTLVMLFGIYAIADGALAIAGAWGEREKYDRWWVTLLEGIAGVVAGVVAFAWQDITGPVLLTVIALWAIARGVLELPVAARLRREIDGEVWSGLSGLLSIVFGIVLAVMRGREALDLLWLIAAYAVLFGGAMAVLGYRLRATNGETGTLSQAPG